MDGLTGLSEAIEKVFPQATTQRCIVHIVRNIYSILDKKKAKEIISVEALLKVLYLRIKDLEKTQSKGTRNWGNVQNQIIELYGDRILKFYVEGNVSNIKN